MNIKDLVRNNQIASHLVTHWVGNVSGYNIAYYLSGGNRLNKELNGLATGLGLGFACNLALHLWMKADDRDSGSNNNKIADDTDLSDSAELIIELLDRTS